MICPQCGVPLAIGSWPYCPHGESHQNVIGDDLPGGVVIENLGHAPMTFYSKQAIVKEAARRGLEPMVRHVDGDQHVQSWATVDPYTLAAGAALVARVTSVRSNPDEVPCDTLRLGVRSV